VPRRDGEVLQQPVEGLLVHVMRLPAPKVPNMPGTVNKRWPARLLRHDRVVNPNRKEDGRTLLAFPCQSGFDFLLHPLARHRRLGQNEEQLVIDADGLIYPETEAVANFHILGSKPAAHAFVLESCVQAFGKGVVLARVADEAGVELEGLIEQRGQIFNQCLWQATAPEKSQGEWPGVGEGAMVEGARATVVACL